MRRLASVLMLIAAALTVAACGGTTETVTEETVVTETIAATVTVTGTEDAAVTETEPATPTVEEEPPEEPPPAEAEQVAGCLEAHGTVTIGNDLDENAINLAFSDNEVDVYVERSETDASNLEGFLRNTAESFGVSQSQLDEAVQRHGNVVVSWVDRSPTDAELAAVEGCL